MTLYASVLWLYAGVASVVFGASVYETLVVHPAWSRKPPESFAAFMGTPVGRMNIAGFWKPVAPLFALSGLVALILAVSAGHPPTPLVVSAVCAVASVAWTLAYFRPTVSRFLEAGGGNAPAERLQSEARRWIRFNWIRSALVVVAWWGALSAAVLSALPYAAQSAGGSDDLVGAWRGRVTFTTGVLAEAKDLEFMYAFNAGGTMTESSNYDAAPPTPPAYGVWKKTGVRTYEARYEFFQVKAVSSADELVKGGGWAPDGHGVLSQKITLSKDGASFDSTIALELFDKSGKPMPGGGEGRASATRMGKPGGALR